MLSNNRKKIYWLSQCTGWGLFVLGNIVSASIQQEVYQTVDFAGVSVSMIYFICLFIFFVGIFTTHVFRNLVLEWKWTSLNILQLAPRMMFSAVAMSVVFTTVNTIFTDLIQGEIPLVEDIRRTYFWMTALNFTALFLLWEIIYFAVHIFENWKREEILNLELRATGTEMELNSLKAQMNPHFMFNCLNSIRALIDEDPGRAKVAITTLSGILRSSFMIGKNQLVPLREELDLISKYLSLEKIRFEERLRVEMDIDQTSLNCEIPPFMLQTLVENGIKHGVSKRIDGGRVYVQTRREDGMLMILICNTGEYKSLNTDSGVGMENTRKRLKLLYGEEASINLTSERNEVCVKIITPINQHHESTDHR